MALGAPFEKDKEGRRLVLSLSRRNKAGEYLVEITPEIWQRVSLYNRIDVDGVFSSIESWAHCPGASVTYGSWISALIVAPCSSISRWFTARAAFAAN